LGPFREIADAIGASNPIEALLQYLVDLTGADRCMFIAVSDDGLLVRSGRSRAAVERAAEQNDADISWAIVSDVVRNGRARIFGDALSDDELTGHRSIEHLALRSIACVPVLHADECLGALYLDHQSTAGLFDRDCLSAIDVASRTVGALASADAHRAASIALKERLTEAEGRIIRAERDRFAGEVLSGKAHDLKNILTSITARSQLAAGYDSLDKTKAALRSIDLAARNAAELTRKMHECSMDHEFQEPEIVDVGRLVEDVVEILSPRIQRAASIGSPIDVSVSAGDRAAIEVVPGELREAILNIMVNACDAMPDGGTLEVDVSSDAESRRVRIAVSDTGAGIEPAVAQRLFDPFFTTKGKDGTGLGLSIVRRVVASYGGDVRYRANDPRGSTFVVELPLASSGASGDEGSLAVGSGNDSARHRWGK